MKLAISNIAWNSEEDAAIRDLLGKYGATGVEVAPTKVWVEPLRAGEVELAECRAFWGARGVKIPALQSLLFGKPELKLFGDAATRARTLAYLTGMMRVAAGLGAKALVFGSPKNRLLEGLGPHAAMDIAEEFFRSAGAAAAARDVVLCIEPNPPHYGCDFVRTIEDGAALVRRVNHPSFRLHVDGGALMLNDEDIDRSIGEAADCMAHFHISDPQLNPIGEHAEAHRRMAGALRRIGWDGWVSIEMRGLASPACNCPNVEKALRFANEVYLQ